MTPERELRALIAELRDEFAEHDAQYEVYSCLERIEKLLAAAPRAAGAQRKVEQEREACICDIQDAIGNWGGPERQHYTQAMHRAIDAIKKRAQGLDLWGKPLAAAEPQVEEREGKREH